MEDRNFDEHIANQKIDIYLAVKEIVTKGRPVTMYGISRITSMSPSYIWKNFGLTGDLIRIIDNAEEENQIRQAINREGVPAVKAKRKNKRTSR